jgi:putative colanic acid biosynthesis acetyltransferase WcaF
MSAVPSEITDPYLAPSCTLNNRIARVAWYVGHLLLVRFSPRPFHAWRAWVYRRFGATVGAGCRIYPRADVWAPWNLFCDDVVLIANGAVIYNPAPIRLASHSVISQDAYLCGATHDIDDPAFPMISAPITVGRYGWICARAVVCSGVEVGEGAVLGLGAVATKHLAPWTVYGGVPARALRQRKHGPQAKVAVPSVVGTQ